MSQKGLLGIVYFICSIASCASAVALNHTNTCQKLRGLYGNKVSLPTSAEFDIVAPENWSKAAQLSPFCVFEPSSSHDVAGALAVMVQDGTKFAVRSGGHMPVPGAANIDKGVLISMNNMKTMQLTENNTIAQLGPGLRWLDVYQWINEYGLMVVGGRFGPVGVSGLLLGGGISYFGSRFGWATNMVNNFEVVLANSTIVNANAEVNPDLFWALKGGSSNYGIVTRFDVKTFPATKMYGGESLFAREYLDELVDAATAYSVVGGGGDDVHGTWNIAIEVLPATDTIEVYSVFFHEGSDSSPASFANFSQIPTLSTTERAWPNLGEALALTNDVQAARTSRQLFMATALQATGESIRLANTTFFEIINDMPELKNVQNLRLSMGPQPLSKSFLEAAIASGGDPMGVDPGNGKLMNLMSSTWDNEEDDDVVYEFSRRWIRKLEEESQMLGIDYPFVYLNDADTSQKPFNLYGQGKSLKKMKAIRNLYDPHHVFQQLLPGGFKLH
ncbi:hypothetical protein GGR57DRAFT_478799 [Xylariaceae sp. FL1272]|nr:hypothetical protein GGR57DRAFT_478799 [Xylariaceae sp. FL1272]